ncbi:MAG: sigma-70 family RNA polymerase sigma factor [Anaerolineaceae bacterium]|nr:sigma-70 family RNA polymerase sigma factor [Anaerolineaceae bacterium]
MNNPETELLWRLRQGDSDAFTPLVEMYQTPVYNLCSRMLGNPQDAEDAAQETFWRAYQAIHRYDPKRSFATWLLSIAAHYCIDQQRKRRLTTFDIDLLPEGNVVDHSPTPERVISQKEEDQIVHNMLSKMNPQDRAAIILRYWYDFSEKEISQALNLSNSAVKSRLFRARKQIAKIWEATHLNSISSGEKQHVSPAF